MLIDTSDIGRTGLLSNPYIKDDVSLTVSNICTAWDRQRCIGSRVRPGHENNVLDGIAALIKDHDWSDSNGQAALTAPPELFPMVRSGKAPATKRIQDWTLVEYRGNVSKMLKADCAERIEVTSLLFIVYTKEAYLNDPDVCGDPAADIRPDYHELSRIKAMDCTHVIIAVLAEGDVGQESRVSPYRFVCNLAGGNNDYKDMNKDQLVKLAQEVRDYSDAGWVSVAEPYYYGDDE